MGTTIGFGEIPYTFTDNQRLWVSICIYASVISWLYAIGNVLRLFQDSSFQQAIATRAFRKSVKRVSQEFYIVCGYGETGKLLTRGLADLNILAVIVDLKSELVGSIELSEISPLPITVCGDISDPEVLQSAGVNNPFCKGVIAVTQDAHTNLNISVAVKLIKQNVKVICRSESDDETKNMASFGTDIIINPFEIFAKRLSLLTEDRNEHRLQSWFVNQHSKEFINLEIAENGLPKGRWIICGYGRLGQSIVSLIEKIGIEVVVIDTTLENGTLTHKTIQGRGTEAATLIEAGINGKDEPNAKSASVIVAASDDDANNLSILITARSLNSQIYTIARVNSETKHSLYMRLNCDYIMRRSQLVSNEVLTNISRPLVPNFLDQISTLEPDQTEQLIDSIEKLSLDTSPVTWRLVLDEMHSPALMKILEEQHTLRVCDVVESTIIEDGAPRKNQKELALLLQSTNKSSSNKLNKHKFTMLPNVDQELKAGDQLLICHAKNQVCRAQKMAHDYEKVDSSIGGNTHYIPILRWLYRRKRHLALNMNTTSQP
jgi:Trk K+ transport system NAD-binding subunit